MKLSEQVRVSLDSYRNSPLFSAVNKEYLEKEDWRLIDKIEKLEDALGFYANPENWEYSYTDTHCPCCTTTWQPKCYDDDGDLARKVLKEIE